MNASVAQITVDGAMALVHNVSFPKSLALRWQDHLKDLVDDGYITEPGMYVTWVWEQVHCNKCATAAGVNVALNEVYTVSRASNGELIVEQGIADSPTTSTPKLTTWPPK